MVRPRDQAGLAHRCAPEPEHWRVGGESGEKGIFSGEAGGAASFFLQALACFLSKCRDLTHDQKVKVSIKCNCGSANVEQKGSVALLTCESIDHNILKHFCSELWGQSSFRVRASGLPTCSSTQGRLLAFSQTNPLPESPVSSMRGCASAPSPCHLARCTQPIRAGAYCF